MYTMQATQFYIVYFCNQVGSVFYYEALTEHLFGLCIYIRNDESLSPRRESSESCAYFMARWNGAPQWRCPSTHKTQLLNRKMVPIVFPPFIFIETLPIRSVVRVGLPLCDVLLTVEISLGQDYLYQYICIYLPLKNETLITC